MVETQSVTMLTQAGYDALVDEGADLLVRKFKTEAQEYARTGERPDDTDERIEKERHNVVNFEVSHPEGALSLGMRYPDSLAYLASILQYSRNSRYTGYCDWVRDDARAGETGPVHPEEALTYAAEYALQKDIQDEFRERIGEVIRETREQAEA